MCKKKINNQRRIILQTGPGGLDKKKKKSNEPRESSLGSRTKLNSDHRRSTGSHLFWPHVAHCSNLKGYFFVSPYISV